MLDIDKTIFDENLLLTQAYCELQLKNTYKNYAAILRSFNPVYEGKEIFSYELDEYDHRPGNINCFVTKWHIDILENKSSYNEIFEMQLMHKRKNIKSIDSKMDHRGRILVAEIDLTVLDGVSEAVSWGFMDLNDCPPIDTWFYTTKNKNSRVLFAWIPEPFKKLADIGMDVNPVDCFYWYADQRPENSNWHAENLDDVPKEATHKEASPESIFSQIKKMFS
ncbi:MAG TPA: hypothetical protein VGN20_19775 [Mucilaginibacter sp.]|jgi:hypothetical protein